MQSATTDSVFSASEQYVGSGSFFCFTAHACASDAGEYPRSVLPLPVPTCSSSSTCSESRAPVGERRHCRSAVLEVEGHHVVSSALTQSLAPFEIIVVHENAEKALPVGSSQLSDDDVPSMHTVHRVEMPGGTTVQVLNPETHEDHGHLGSRVRYTDYEIRIKTTDISFDKSTSEGVRRTFNEFLWLREQMDLTGVSNLPSLPRRTFFGCFDEEFIENRRLQLQHFLEILVVYHPAVLTSSIFHKFVQSNDTVDEMNRMIDTTHALQDLPDVAAQPTIILVKDMYARHEKSRTPSTCPTSLSQSSGNSATRNSATSNSGGGESVVGISTFPSAGSRVEAPSPPPLHMERQSNSLGHGAQRCSGVETSRASSDGMEGQLSSSRRVHRSGGRDRSAVSRDSSMETRSPSPAHMDCQRDEPCGPRDSSFGCDAISDGSSRLEAHSPSPTGEDSQPAPTGDRHSNDSGPLLAHKHSCVESHVFTGTGRDQSLYNSIGSDSDDDGGWCIVELVECRGECDRSTQC